VVGGAWAAGRWLGQVGCSILHRVCVAGNCTGATCHSQGLIKKKEKRKKASFFHSAFSSAVAVGSCC
jgi:hypothetical protein